MSGPGEDESASGAPEGAVPAPRAPFVDAVVGRAAAAIADQGVELSVEDLEKLERLADEKVAAHLCDMIAKADPQDIEHFPDFFELKAGLPDDLACEVMDVLRERREAIAAGRPAPWLLANRKDPTTSAAGRVLYEAIARAPASELDRIEEELPRLIVPDEVKVALRDRIVRRRLGEDLSLERLPNAIPGAIPLPAIVNGFEEVLQGLCAPLRTPADGEAAIELRLHRAAIKLLLYNAFRKGAQDPTTEDMLSAAPPFGLVRSGPRFRRRIENDGSEGWQRRDAGPGST